MTNVLAQCPVCMGRGQFRYTFGIEYYTNCVECKGTGWITVDLPNNKENEQMSIGKGVNTQVIRPKFGILDIFVVIKGIREILNGPPLTTKEGLTEALTDLQRLLNDLGWTEGANAIGTVMGSELFFNVVLALLQAIFKTPGGGVTSLSSEDREEQFLASLAQLRLNK